MIVIVEGIIFICVAYIVVIMVLKAVELLTKDE
jgi:hypothetical protein